MEELPAPYTCMHCTNPTWNESDVCDKCLSEWSDTYLEASQ